jgi:Zn-dependent M28 family amino/carboxypeptidase
MNNHSRISRDSAKEGSQGGVVPMKRFVVALALIIAVAGVAGCSKPAQGPAPGKPVAFPDIDGNAVLQHTKVLASDEYEGRAPGTKGEELTVAYIEDQFRKAGVKPGNPDGTFIQKVPLVGITPDPNATLTLRKGAKQATLKFKDDFVAWTKRVATPGQMRFGDVTITGDQASGSETIGVSGSDIVFVGYGVQAPEFKWDDYKGADLKGKTLVVLVGDPPVPDPGDPSKLDAHTFGGRAMTYYGRWTYKYEMGAKVGADAVLIVHETGPAGYPYSVVQGKTREQFDLVAADNNRSRAAVEGWIPLEQAHALFSMAGLDFDAAKKQALGRDFKPVPLGVKASITLRNTVRKIDSRNVVGKIDGSDPVLKNEYVVYTSHWDHFGIGAPVNGDKVYHGAKDNATGIGGMIEIGRAFAKLSPAPKRSILLLAVTAEEQGLLGSEYYATAPLYPLSKTAAVINMDALNVNGKTKDLTVVGLGASDLDDYASQVAGEQARVVKGDPAPENGGYYRSDHFPFAKQGVPAINSGGGSEYVGRPADWGEQIRKTYTANDYHKPSDTVRPDWDMSGAVQDLQYYWMMGYRVAQAGKFPEWKPGNEFKATRDAQLKGAQKGTN